MSITGPQTEKRMCAIGTAYANIKQEDGISDHRIAALKDIFFKDVVDGMWPNNLETQWWAINDLERCYAYRRKELRAWEILKDEAISTSTA